MPIPSLGPNFPLPFRDTSIPFYTVVGLFGAAVAGAFKALMVMRKAWRAGKVEAYKWASALLDNHLTHIQAAAEDGAKSLKEMAATNATLALEMRSMREDLLRHQDADSRVQQELLAGVETIKAKLDT